MSVTIIYTTLILKDWVIFMVKNADSGYSLGKVASYCGVTRKTILRWVQDGTIESFSLPSGHNRVPRPALIDFLKSNKMPVPDELQDKTKKSVLVVDDDPNIRKFIVNLFKPHFNVSEASNGVDACISIGSNTPDIIFLDNLMPHMDGLQVCRQLKEHPKLNDTKIVIISAHLDGGREEVFNDLVEKVIKKPFKPAELVSTALNLASV